MTPEELKMLREKHTPVFQSTGKAGEINYCAGCKGPNNTLINLWPCEVVQVIDACKNRGGTPQEGK